MRRAILYSLAFCYLVTAIPAVVAAQDLLHPAPASAPADRGAGFVPPPLDLAHLAPPPGPAARLRDMATRMDWRAENMVSPVKNQGACGSCYAFAAAADLESRLLRDFGLLVDLSENHLKECHFQERSCLGGNAQIVTNLLTLQGAVLETCDPYVAADVACNTTCSPQFTVLDWIWLSGSTLPSTTSLKQALLDHGPLATTVFAGDDSSPAWQSAFNGWSGGSGLYYAGSQAPNHAVTLVGWDDEHPHTGGGQGCWIVKNSWGEGWGSSCGFGETGGYFYIAYGSAGLGKWTSAITEFMPAYPELAVLAWDAGGWTGAYGTGQTTVWGLARFTAGDATALHRVEFWTTDATDRVDAYVYASFNGSSLSGLLASAEDRSFPAAGYHSIALGEPLPLTAGNDYYVALRLQNAAFGYPLAVDDQSPPAAGRTWISVNGATWYDLGGSYSCTAGIRLRTSPHEALPAVEPGARPPAPPAAAGELFQLEPPWPNPFNPGTSLTFTLDRPAPVRLRIYDLQGRLVATLLDAALPAGRHHAHWAGRDQAGRPQPAGVYLCRLDDGQRWRSQRLILVK